MNKNKLNINITHGKLESFSVFSKENGIDISATIGLYTDQEKKITTFSVDTRSYYGDTEFELPISCIEPIKKIIQDIEYATVLSCRENQLKLE